MPARTPWPGRCLRAARCGPGHAGSGWSRRRRAGDRPARPRSRRRWRRRGRRWWCSRRRRSSGGRPGRRRGHHRRSGPPRRGPRRSFRPRQAGRRHRGWRPVERAAGRGDLMADIRQETGTVDALHAWCEPLLVGVPFSGCGGCCRFWGAAYRGIATDQRHHGKRFRGSAMQCSCEATSRPVQPGLGAGRFRVFHMLPRLASSWP
jgi:hypothetical protein